MVEIPWHPTAQDLFQELMQAGPPPAYAESAARGVRRAALNAARERGSQVVEIQDVALGCWRAAPPVFRPNVVAHLAQQGIEIRPGAPLGGAGSTAESRGLAHGGK